MTQTRRLEVLAGFLETFADTHPDDTFDLTTWFELPDGDGLNSRGGCGTAACACGWAAQIPELAADGFALATTGTPTFEGAYNFAAAADFFGLTRGQSHELFDADYYSDDPGVGEFFADAAGVARKIRALLAGQDRPGV